MNETVIVASLRSPFNTRKPLVLDDFFNCFSSLFQPFGVLFETKCFAVVVHVRSAIVFGVAAFDVATVAAVGVLVYRLALRLCGGGGGGFGGLVGVLGGVGGFVESSSLAAFVGVGACGFGALGGFGGVDGGAGLAGLAGLGHGHARCSGQRVLGAQGGCEVLGGLHLLGDGLAGLGGDAGEGRGDVVEQVGGFAQ